MKSERKAKTLGIYFQDFSRNISQKINLLFYTIDNTTKKLYNKNTTKKLYQINLLEHNMKVHTYENSSGKDLIKKYIDKLSKEEQVDGYSVLQAFEEDRIEELNIKPWQGKVWEVYFYKHNRMFYITIENEDVYLLHACRKQKNKTETTNKNIVISRAKELGKLLNKTFI